MFYLLFACNDYTVAGIEKRQQQILVYPNHINFGHLIAGEDSATETFTIINTGDADLIISAPNLVSGNTRFNLNTDSEEYSIPPSSLIDFEINYTPKTHESNGGYIEILSNDESNSAVNITLEGYGDAPVMEVSPIDFDYGEISIGCDNEERITIKNTGNLDLEITDITQMVTQPVDIILEFGSLPELPWTLNPQQEIDFLVSYIPTEIGTDQSQITIKGSDPYTPEIITTQIGISDVEQWFSQTWQQEEIPILDVLWVIDNSGSMNQFQTSLATNINSFISAFLQTGADYHMSVITTDSWNVSTVLDSSTTNIEQELSNLVMQGTYGSGMEKGIEMSYRALSSSASAGPGSSFWREDATLIVIYVSDEQDWSNPGWNSYINFFDNLKPQGQFIPYGVISDVPAGCQYTAPNGSVRNLQAGYGYWDLIDYYGGSWYSICATDWGVQLQSLGNQLVGRRTFELEELDPIVSTIEVYVNGQLTTSWQYDQSINSVVFLQDSIPEEGQTITIDYAVWGCGE